MSTDWIEVRIDSEHPLEELAGLLSKVVFSGIPFDRRPGGAPGEADTFEMSREWLCGRFVLSDAGTHRTLRPFLAADPAPNADSSLYTLCGHVAEIIKHRLKIDAGAMYVVDTSKEGAKDGESDEDGEFLLKLRAPSSGRGCDDLVHMLGRVWRLQIDGGDGAEDCEYIEFQGVEGYRVEIHMAITSPRWIDAYDRLIDLGDTEWLNQVRLTLHENKGDSTGLRHLMIYLDDGPCYEILCRDYRYHCPSF